MLQNWMRTRHIFASENTQLPSSISLMNHHHHNTTMSVLSYRCLLSFTQIDWWMTLIKLQSVLFLIRLSHNLSLLIWVPPFASQCYDLVANACHTIKMVIKVSLSSASFNNIAVFSHKPIAFKYSIPLQH